MIAVAGASGEVGGRLVRRLARHGHAVRAISRRPTDLVVPHGVVAVPGDADAPDGMDGAFDGADRAFVLSAEGVAPDRGPTHLPRMVAAARRAGVGHLVLLSVFSGGEGDDLIGRWWACVESAVTDAGASWTLLRPGRFFSNALGWAAPLRAGDTVRVPFADQPAAGVDPDDIAAVAARALLDDTLRATVLPLTGPECLTPRDEVGRLGVVLGRELAVEALDADATRDAMVRHGGMHPLVADAVLRRVATTRDGAVPVPTVERILGRPPRTFAAWATAHADDFPAAGAAPPGG